MAAAEENTPESIAAKDDEAGDEDLASLNAPARNATVMPSKVPTNVPYSRTALFNLLKYMEYSTDRETYDMA